jgi:hypothetical protein
MAKKNMLKDVSQRSLDEFHLEMGRFICAFSDAEHFAFFLFSFVSDIRFPKSNAIIGGMRLADVIGIINRLTEKSHHSDEIKKEIRDLLSHLQSISAYRHVLIHLGAEIQEGNLSTTNMNSAKTMESVQQWTTDLSNLRAATHDLNTISLRIGLVRNWNQNRISPSARRALFAPWRYKSVQPENLFRRIEKERQKQLPRPESSRV